MADPITLYGAATGTAGALAAVWVVYNGLFRDRAKLKIQPSLAVMGSEGTTLRCVAVQVSNAGRRPTTVESCRLAAKDGRRLALVPRFVLQYGDMGQVVDESHGTPKRLNEGDSHTFYFPLDTVKQWFAEGQPPLISAHVEDGTGRTWKESLSKSLRRALMNEGEIRKGD